MAPGLQIRSRSRKRSCLTAEVLGDRLDDEVDVGQRLARGRAGDPAEQRVGVLAAHPALLHRAGAVAGERGAHGLATLSSQRATKVTAYPALAKTSMMPVAIVPDPTTPTEATGRSDTPAGGPPAGVWASATTCGRARLGVRVEAPTRLAAEQPGADHLLDDRAGRVQPVAALLVHRVEDLVGGVEADQVEQRERAHRVAAAEAHGGVEVLAGRVAALVHRHRVVEVAEQQGVGDEAGLVADDHRLLAEPLGERLDVLEDVVGGDHGADHLDELLHRRRVEEVHADDPLGVRRRDGDLGDRQRGGVGGQHGVRRDDRVDLAEQLLLEVELLRNGLDHELAVGEVGQVTAEGDPGVQRVVLLLGQLAAAQRPAGAAAEHRLAVLDRRPRRPRRRSRRSRCGRRPRRSPRPSSRVRSHPHW